MFAPSLCALLRTVRSLAVVCACCSVGPTAWADPPVTAVEEDWELVVGEADLATNAPQITTVFSARGDLDAFYAVFTLNHRTIPAYGAGGMQLQIWFNEIPLIDKAANESGALATAGETVRWTQRLSLVGNILQYEVSNGTSNTWGGFGNGQLKIATASNLDDLSNYQTDVSAKNSGIGFASNRVQSLKITQVRRYAANQLVSTTSDPASVYPRP